MGIEQVPEHMKPKYRKELSKDGKKRESKPEIIVTKSEAGGL